MNKVLLEVRNLQVYFHVKEGVARAVDGVSLNQAALGGLRSLRRQAYDSGLIRPPED